MSKIVFSSIVLSLLLFKCGLCYPSLDERRGLNNYDKNNNNNDNSYDYLILAQTWPQTICWDLNKRWADAETATCSPCPGLKNLNNWGIHGLWPSRTHGKHIAFCSKNAKYHPELITSGLRAELSEKWRSGKITFGMDAFWAYEYKKHGTCALDMQSTNSVPKYFKKALELADRYNIANLIAPQGIVPGNTYGFDQIHRAITTGLGATARTQCARNPITKEQYIEQISVCFNKSFQPIDCPNQSISNCKRNAGIIYPKNLRSC